MQITREEAMKRKTDSYVVRDLPLIENPEYPKYFTTYKEAVSDRRGSNIRGDLTVFKVNHMEKTMEFIE